MTSLPRRAALRLLRPLALVAVSLPLAGISSFEALFAPSAELWPRWQAHDAAATATIDHAAWTRLLQTYVSRDGDGLNRFDYAGVSEADRAALDRYIGDLAALPIDRYNRAEQFAYWLNLYNALTVQVVLDHQPVDSILDIDISPGLFANGPWDKALVNVAGEALTLNDIEHRILRPIWRDPRIHYGVNCASVGCPNLQAEAFTGAGLEAMLERAARDYVNSPRGLGRADDGLVVSSIYIWFQEDFGDDDAVIDHLRRYADTETLALIDRAPRLADHRYDWSLNGLRKPGS